MILYRKRTNNFFITTVEKEDVSSQNNNADFLEAKRKISCLSVVNDAAERGFKLIQDFNEPIMADEEKKQCLYLDCKKTTLKKGYHD